MIQYEPGFGLMMIESLTIPVSAKRKLPNSLYVFGAHPERSEMIYLSPDISYAEKAALFIHKHVEPRVVIQHIGSPPYVNWIAFNRLLREKSPSMCAAVALFMEQAVNNQISW